MTQTFIQLKTLDDDHVLIFKDVNGNLLDCESFERRYFTYLDMAYAADLFEEELKRAGVL